MASKATQKGNRGQNKAIDLIEKWTGKKFKSSAQHGMPGYNLDPHVGDILCATEGHYFPFCIEVKNYADINFSHLLQPNIKNVTILEFWDQVAGDAKNTKKVPILLMRTTNNRLPADFFFLVVTQEFAKLCHIELGVANADDLVSLRYHDYSKDEPLMILRSDQFFRTDYKNIKEIAKTHKKSLYGKTKKS
jgi:hypothetical protein